jgi:hypothetical protein
MERAGVPHACTQCIILLIYCGLHYTRVKGWISCRTAAYGVTISSRATCTGHRVWGKRLNSDALTATCSYQFGRELNKPPYTLMHLWEEDILIVCVIHTASYCGDCKEQAVILCWSLPPVPLSTHPTRPGNRCALPLAWTWLLWGHLWQEGKQHINWQLSNHGPPNASSFLLRIS